MNETMLNEAPTGTHTIVWSLLYLKRPDGMWGPVGFPGAVTTASLLGIMKLYKQQTVVLL